MTKLHTSAPSPSPFRLSRLDVAAPLLMGFVIIALSYGFYCREADQVEQNLRDRESMRVKMYTYLLKENLRSVLMNLRTLADGDGLMSFLASGHPVDMDRAIHRAKFFSLLDPSYDQVRYLDEHGHEVIRVNEHGQIVPPEKLQDKGDRPYFQKTWGLGFGNVYVSAFDLNVENGRVEQPFKPTIRFATPIVDMMGKKRGVYIINYLGDRMLSQVSSFAPEYEHRFRMLNSQGYWLKASTPDTEWGFMFPGKAHLTLAQTDPTLWEKITRQDTGQVEHAGGLFTWHKLTPQEFVPQTSGAVVSEDDFYVLASDVTQQEFEAHFETLRLVCVIVTSVLFCLTWVAWKFFHAHQKSRQDLDRYFLLSEDLLCISGFDGRFLRVNPSWEKLLGYTTEELTSRPYLDFIHPDDRARTTAEATHIAEGSSCTNFENRYRCRDGSYRWLSWSARALMDEKLIFSAARDLTARKKSEEQIQMLNQELNTRARQLEVANKELEAFSYSVSHDLRAPLRHMDGFVGLLAKQIGEQLDERGRRYLNVIADSAKKMGVLIDDLLVFSRMSRAEIRKTAVSSDDMVREVLASLEAETNGRNIHWNIAPLPKVEADSAMLRQVWVNLLSNAIKYTRTRDPAKIQVGVVDDPGSEQVFFVRDNGVGFDMQYADKLFGVFQRLHRAEEFEGTGIGLANVQRIISRQGGRVWAEAKLDEGATFFFSLPKTPNPS